MTRFEQEQAAKKFVEIWKDKGNERSEAQKYWIQLLRDVYGVEDSEQYIDFELPIKIVNTSFADGFIADTKVLIEMKGKDIDLDKPEKQSDGSSLTPFRQAKRYADELVYREGVRWIVTSNFQEIRVYDMKKRHQEPEIIFLKNLGKEYYRLQFLVNEKDENIKKEEDVSFKAGQIIGELYDIVKPLYANPEDEENLHNLNKFCVRLVFCLYAEDANLFGNRMMFHDYLNNYKAEDLREALIELFNVLNTKKEDRSIYIKEELKAFPYVNGGLFEGDIEIPRLTNEFKKVLLEKASENFDWTDISPTIFGGVFESTLNPETRRKGGMHYTSVENIKKVINPLFLNNLQYKYEKIKSETSINKKRQQLNNFQEELSKLKFLDPACGSGNFLTQTYLEIREIENNIIKELIRIDRKQYDNQIQFGGDNTNLIKVSINQFYGIEVNDFAVSVAKTALWIAEHQMFEKTRAITYMKDEFLPLRTYNNIVEGNALRIDWNYIISNKECNYIMGNPPFIGMKEMTESNKEDMKLVVPIKKFKQMDYVACWYFKAAEYIKSTNIEVAFVSSNSISQGEQALTIWKPLLLDNKIVINFAYRTFNWDSEAHLKAHVHCVIISFSYINRATKFIYEKIKKKACKNINQYLTPAETIFIDKIGKPICNVEPMTKGAQLIDGGNFIIGNEQEKNKVIAQEPTINQYIRRYYNAHDLINGGEEVYVLYLEKCPPEIIRKSPFLKERVQKVYEYRANNESPSTNILKDTPSKYFQSQVPNGKSLVVPVVSSINRRYIPICFMKEGMVYTNALFFVDNASIYTFGILTSNVHMSWVRTVCGRLKSDYRYSNTMAYNTFPWPKCSIEQKNKIEKTAQTILNVRAKYPNSSLADLYDELTMPVELRKAHQENDKAVMEAYGFDWRKMSESDCVAELMKMYKELTDKE